MLSLLPLLSLLIPLILLSSSILSTFLFWGRLACLRRNAFEGFVHIDALLFCHSFEEGAVNLLFVSDLFDISVRLFDCLAESIELFPKIVQSRVQIFGHVGDLLELLCSSTESHTETGGCMVVYLAVGFHEN